MEGGAGAVSATMQYWPLQPMRFSWGTEPSKRRHDQMPAIGMQTVFHGLPTNGYY